MKQEKTPTGPFDELAPSVEEGRAEVFSEKEHVKQVEQGSVHTGTSAALAQNSAASIPQPNTARTSARQPGGAQQTYVPHVATPQIADDEDLIEKEWIESAKRIVAQTKGDPHAQSESLKAVKKDYKKKRFNIDNELGSVG